MKVDLEIAELDIIFRALNIVDQFNIFTRQLKDKLAETAEPIINKKETK